MIPSLLRGGSLVGISLSLCSLNILWKGVAVHHEQEEEPAPVNLEGTQLPQSLPIRPRLTFLEKMTHSQQPVLASSPFTVPYDGSPYSTPFSLHQLFSERQPSIEGAFKTTRHSLKEKEKKKRITNSERGGWESSLAHWSTSQWVLPNLLLTQPTDWKETLSSARQAATPTALAHYGVDRLGLALQVDQLLFSYQSIQMEDTVSGNWRSQVKEWATIPKRPFRSPTRTI